MKQVFKIDLFSDTNTNPSQEMRAFMCQAKVGNEVAAEDPTVNLLLEKVCDLLGKESAVFLPSGTMCNGIAYRVFCKKPGDMIILDKTSHPLLKSSGLIAGLAHAVAYEVNGERGIFSADQIESILSQERVFNVSCPRLISIEQATNFGGGAIWPLETLTQVCNLAHKYNVRMHMDGAHLLNAVVETNISASEYSQLFDSVWIDFSKSLGAPMGAVLAGSKEFIEEAWYYKFQQGGGMHQAGILAAGCLYALDNNIKELLRIHAHAKNLARQLNTLSFIKIDPKTVETNIVCLDVIHPTLNAYDFEARLKESSIRVLALNQKTIRVMTHLDITDSNIKEVLESFVKIGKN